MPQNPRSLINLPAPVTGPVNYPTEEVPNALDTTLRGVMTGLGLEEQRPGDLAGALGSGAGLAVSIYPGLLAKARGLAILNKLKRDGLPLVAMGQEMGTRHIPSELMNALEMAQKRWPRLFGHLDEITDLDLLDNMRGKTLGVTAPGRGLPPDNKNLTSKLRVSADKFYGNQDEAYNTVGHELTHAADFLRKGKDAVESYKYSQKLPGDYNASAAELRARLQGARTKAYGRGLQRREVEPYTNTAYPVSDYAIKLPGEMQKPIDSRISGLPPEPMPAVKGPIETNEEKLIRMLQERFDRQSAGIAPDPRVPRK